MEMERYKMRLRRNTVNQIKEPDKRKKTDTVRTGKEEARGTLRQEGLCLYLHFCLVCSSTNCSSDP